MINRILWILVGLFYLASLKNQAVKLYWKNQSEPIPHSSIKKCFRTIENIFVWILVGNRRNIYKECDGRIKVDYWLIAAILLSLFLLLCK